MARNPGKDVGKSKILFSIRYINVLTSNPSR